MSEIWRDIKGYEGLYQVSNLGRVYSLIKNKIMSNIKIYGYYHVHLSKNRKHKKILVHRLVAETFIPNPYNLPCVNHKNEIRTDNRVENLEWCTYEYNINYGTRTKKVSKIIIQYDLNGNFIKEWPSISEIEKELNYNKSAICRCCKKVIKTAYGYLWKYKKEER